MRYVAVSGGADSVAMVLWLHERGEEFEMVFSDSGAELPEVFWLLPRLARHVGRPLHVLNNGTFFQHLAANDFHFPSARIRWCTRVLKARPQDAFMNQNAGESLAIGIRADEPQRQRPIAGVEWETRHPLVEAGMGKSDVLALCRRHDLLNPVYEWRSNTSCFCCPMGRVSDWQGLLRHHPLLFMVSEEWENESISRGRTEPAYLEKLTLSELRHADRDQLGMFAEEEVEPCSICAR